jgi:hypothetical protein
VMIFSQPNESLNALHRFLSCHVMKRASRQR